MKLKLSIIKSQCYILTLTIFFYILFPLIFLLFFLIHLVRRSVSFLKLIFRPDLGKILTPQSSFLAVDNPYVGTPKWNLCIWVIYEGDIDIENIVETFYRQVVLREAKNGTLAYPELQQYFSQWLGFLFWKSEDNFSMRAHSRHYESNNNSTINDLDTIIKNLTWAPFKEKTSPWEFLWIRNYRPRYLDGVDSIAPKTVKIFRVHHGLGDGVANIKLLLEHLCNVSLKTTAKPRFEKRNGFGTFARVLKAPVVAPYQFIKMLVEAKDSNDWHPRSESELVRPFNNAFSDRINLDFIRSIKQRHGVSYNAVVMTAITGGIRRIMLQQGKAVPEVINAGLPIPLPGHPGTMTNHWTSAFIQLPVGMKDSFQRLAKIEENLRILKGSYAPAFNHVVVSTCGAVFSGLIKKLNKNDFSTTTISNFPGPTFKRECVIGEKIYEMLDINFAAGNGTTRSGLSFNMVSFGDGVRIITEANRCILPDDAAVQDLNRAIVDELNLLAKTNPILEVPTEGLPILANT
ncbi:unnamed protein product [Allacma fusca]|uniref:O-acyltransferase WSD1 C-terminal domain-containing protein n=1 Tax=Allacma fusca TaxID=39272 RepID=A0A8J2JL05_9HEXA|nr:unnamed protein product [Allacma fusca]